MSSVLIGLNATNAGFAIRCKKIKKALLYANATSAESAVFLHETGIKSPNAFKNANKFLIKKGQIAKTEDGKYYLIHK